MTDIGCFSSPDVSCRGFVTGDERNDNVAELNRFALRMSRAGNETGTCRSSYPLVLNENAMK